MAKPSSQRKESLLLSSSFFFNLTRDKTNLLNKTLKNKDKRLVLYGGDKNENVKKLTQKTSYERSYFSLRSWIDLNSQKTFGSRLQSEPYSLCHLVVSQGESQTQKGGETLQKVHGPHPCCVCGSGLDFIRRPYPPLI